MVDGLSGLLAPFASAEAYVPGAPKSAQRWRLAWASRALQQIACETGVAVLVLSHTVGGRDAQGQDRASHQLALGQLWANAIGTRLELSKEFQFSPGEQKGDCDEQDLRFRLSLRKSARGPVGKSAVLAILASGLTASAGNPCRLR